MRCKFFFFIVLITITQLYYNQNVYSIIIPDINNDQKIGLEEAIYILNTIVDSRFEGKIENLKIISIPDINYDNKIGLAECIFIISEISKINYSISSSKIFLSSPPYFNLKYPELIISNNRDNYIVYGTLNNKQPISFDSKVYNELTYVYSLDCRPRSNQENIIINWAKPTSDSYVDLLIDIQTPIEGYFWVNSKKCSVNNYKKTVPDNVIVPYSKDVFFTSKELIFSGEITEIEENIPIYEEWNKRHEYQIKVETIFLNLRNISIDSIRKTEVIGWIPPKKGTLYFFGEYNSYTGIISSYISETPRLSWFDTRSGRYIVKILNKEYLESICCSYYCIDKYMISGEVIETQQGVLNNNKIVNFYYDDPLFENNMEVKFIGIINDGKDGSISYLEEIEF